MVPVSGFYEWAVIGGRKRAYCIEPTDDGLWMFAGLSEVWKGPEGLVESFTIIKTEANAAMSELHHRMPVILGKGDWQAWLDAKSEAPALQALLKPSPDGWLRIFEIGPAVGNVRNDGPTCSMKRPSSLVP